MADLSRLMTDLTELGKWADMLNRPDQANTARRARNALSDIDSQRAELVQTVSGLNRKLAQAEQQAAQLREALREAEGSA